MFCLLVFLCTSWKPGAWQDSGESGGSPGTRITMRALLTEPIASRKFKISFLMLLYYCGQDWTNELVSSRNKVISRFVI